MKGVTSQMLAALSVACVAVFFAVNHFVTLFDKAFVASLTGRIAYARTNFAASFNPMSDYFIFIGLDGAACGISLLAALLVVAAFMYMTTQGVFRRGEEHGSARWATRKEMDAFTDFKAPNNNLILSKDVRLRAIGQNDFEHGRNRNVLVLGGSGAGKTFGYIKPNLMQIPAPENETLFGAKGVQLETMEKYARSYFVTDSKGMTRVEAGYLFAEHGYNVLEFNVIDFFASNHFNVFQYIHTTDDVLSFATCLINNTKGEGEQAGEDFWVKSEKLFYQFLGTYMLYEVAEEERNFNTFCGLLDLAQVADNGEFSGLDILIHELEYGEEYIPEDERTKRGTKSSPLASAGATSSMWKKKAGARSQPNHPAVIAYHSFKSGATETLQSILISCKVRVAPLRSEGVMEVLKDDEMDLDRVGDRKTVIFCVFNDQDETFNFLIALMIWVMLKQLYLRCSTKYANSGGALPVGVDLLLDEAANFYIPGLEHTISTCRSRSIGISVILQSKAQLQARYGDSADTIIDCCDSLVFLGGKSTETNKMLEEMLGQQTVTTDNTSESKGKGGSMSKTIAQHGRALLQSNEIAKMKKTDCLVLLQGAAPWFGAKVMPTDLPMYPYMDPGHKGGKFARGFDFYAYKQNKRYYNHPAALALEQRVKVDTFHGWSADGGYERLVIDYHIDFHNISAVSAYNLVYNADLECVCVTNLDAIEKGQLTPFPNFDMRGRSWFYGEAFSNRHLPPAPENDFRGEDVFRFIDGNHEYKFEGINIAPDERFHIKFSMEVEPELIVATLKEARQDACAAKAVFRFTFEPTISCANADVGGLVARSDFVEVSLGDNDELCFSHTQGAYVKSEARLEKEAEEARLKAEEDEDDIAA